MHKIKKRFSAEERRKQILRSAIRVFAQSNYRAARVADIAAETGISEATIYKYFPSKKAIFLEILTYMSERIIILWEREYETEPDALKALRAMGKTYYERMTNHPEELKVHFQAVSEVNDSDIAERLRLDHERYVQFIAKVLEKGVRQGTIRSDRDIYTMAWLVNGIGILMNMVKLLSFDTVFNETIIPQIIDHLIESVMA
ncbi:MAG: TetR/AcrR family transcriptional regulator [Deltaproteobacteria bacterium]|nr:TetR/AcrR family transcriptional regulator [Deltaproteobacteria bacterium]